MQLIKCLVSHKVTLMYTSIVGTLSNTTMKWVDTLLRVKSSSSPIQASYTEYNTDNTLSSVRVETLIHHIHNIQYRIHR